MSGWMVVDPKYSTKDGVKVARVDVHHFPDEIDYESMLGRAFEGDEYLEWKTTVGLVILATPDAYEKLQKLMGGQWGDVPESAVIQEMTKLALERQVVVFKWFPVS